MKAIILAAGLGTRLRPLTNTKPKALVEVAGVPLLEIVLKRLIAAGVTEVIINLHHFPEQIRDFVHSKSDFGLRVEFSHEKDRLLDTGGGLQQAAHFFDDGAPFYLHNVDIVSDFDLRAMLAAHMSEPRLVTLAVNQRETARYFIFDADLTLCGWKSLKTGVVKNARAPKGNSLDLAFAGVHVISPEIFALLRERGSFSIVDSYLRLAAQGETIKAYRIDGFEWRDVGKLSELS